MKTLNILLGNCEGLLNDHLEGLIHDCCEGHALAHFTKTAWLDEFIRLGCSSRYDLVLVFPRNLRVEVTGKAALSSLAGGLRAIRSLKSQRPAGLIAFAVEETSPEAEALAKAGADAVLWLPLHEDELKTAVRSLLHLPALTERLMPRQPFFAELWRLSADRFAHA